MTPTTLPDPSSITSESPQRDYAASQVVVLRPEWGCRWINIAELWAYRQLLLLFVIRTLHVRYKHTILGFAWAILQPLSFMIIFAVVFKRLAVLPTGDLPYPLFALSGIILWNLGANSLNAAANSVLNSEKLITQVYFPRLLLPISAIGSPLIDFAIALLFVTCMLIGYGVVPGPQLVLVPVLLALTLMLSVGLGAILAALNVMYRDVRVLTPFLIQCWMFATPSIYMDIPVAATKDTSDATSPHASYIADNDGHSDKGPSSEKPDRGQWRASHTVMLLNPMVVIIASFRAAVSGGQIMWGWLLTASLSVTALFVVGCVSFRNVEHRFADLL